MKTGIISSPTIASEGLEKSKMGMSAKGMDVASYFLRDKIYSNKPLAVIREYICNAVDEHVKHNIDKNVLVKLHLDTDNGGYIWSVRDYAKGLSDHDLRNIFGQYFESTKGNDNDSIGGFGIGSKAGHCYADTFYVVSHYAGTKTVYACVLGAGQKGVPVGEIFAVSSEPTNETGIEISLEVNKDWHTFDRITKIFVKNFYPDAKLEYHRMNLEVVTPSVPNRFEKLGDFTISAYDVFETVEYSSGDVFIRMGGVIYPSNYRYVAPNDATINGSVVVDVPIGSLSIPISREAIEKTAQNDKVFSEISLEIDKLLDIEKKTLKVPDMAELLVQPHWNWSEIKEQFKTKWFSYNFARLYPDTYRFKNTVSYHAPYAKCPVDKNGKQVIYLIPDIKNQNAWKTRLFNFLNPTPGTTNQFLYLTMGVHNIEELEKSDLIDISNVVFLDVKKLGLPKLPTVGGGPRTQYASYCEGTCKSYTPDELLQFVEKRYGEFEDDWHLTVENVRVLNARTVASTIGWGQSRSFWTFNSQKMIDSMLERGFIKMASDEYENARKRIEENTRKKEEKRQALHNTNYKYMSVDRSPYLEKAIQSKPDRIDKLIKKLAVIKSEDSFRGRMLRKMPLTNWGEIPSNSRQDIRTLLRIKN